MLKKAEILKYVQTLGNAIGKDVLGELFQNDNERGDKKIGHGQFREIAALCAAAECYEEIELLVKYNTAKAEIDKSWAKLCGNRKFGELIVDFMQKIKAAEQNEADVLEDLVHFFGYLYWQSRVWSAENPSVYTNNRNQNTQNYRPNRRGGNR